MSALYIIGGIILFFLLLLLAPLSLRAAYTGGELKASAHYLVFRFKLTPQDSGKKAKKKAKKKDKPKAGPEKKQEEKKKTKEKKSLGEQWEYIQFLMRGSRRPLKTLRRHIVLYRVRIGIRIAREDAHQTAVTYGKAASFVTLALELCGLMFVLKKPSVTVVPDFTGRKSAYDISLRVRIRPLFALIAAVQTVFLIVKAGRSDITYKPKKGGPYESAASHR